ncbi:hypothetical protein M513_09337 [Trichuris suis]|uniref:Uncharacterized protein n=1 Tax=Trichuris suis TaxID=68888 RepID=A0A085LY24_9BILA|nr:hypothetical protein M513_09337 [Trichuris suis]
MNVLMQLLNFLLSNFVRWEDGRAVHGATFRSQSTSVGVGSDPILVSDASLSSSKVESKAEVHCVSYEAAQNITHSSKVYIEQPLAFGADGIQENGALSVVWQLARKGSL